MATPPNNPFDDNPSYGTPQPSGPQTGAQMSGQPPKKSKTGLYILFGCLGVSALGLLICCGGIFAMMNFGLGVVAGEVQWQIEDSEAITQNIGEIESLEMSFSDLIQNAQKGPEQQDMMAFRVKGDKGSGVVYAKVDQTGGSNTVTEARLEMEDGTVIPIELGGAADLSLDDLDEGIFDTGELAVPGELEPATAQ